MLCFQTVCYLELKMIIVGPQRAKYIIKFVHQFPNLAHCGWNILLKKGSSAKLLKWKEKKRYSFRPTEKHCVGKLFRILFCIFASFYESFHDFTSFFFFLNLLFIFYLFFVQLYSFVLPVRWEKSLIANFVYFENI